MYTYVGNRSNYICQWVAGIHNQVRTSITDCSREINEIAMQSPTESFIAVTYLAMMDADC